MLLALLVAGYLVLSDRMDLSRRRLVRSPIDEARLLGVIAAELRTGATVRSAVAGAALTERDPRVRTAGWLARAGAPLEEVAAQLCKLPINGRRLEAALAVVAQTGGRSATIFAGLADRAVREAALRREKRTLTAQVRMSALVVGSLPVVSLAAGGWSRLRVLLASGSGGIGLATAGLAMKVLGVGINWRRAMR